MLLLPETIKTPSLPQMLEELAIRAWEKQLAGDSSQKAHISLGSAKAHRYIWSIRQLRVQLGISSLPKSCTPVLICLSPLLCLHIISNSQFNPLRQSPVYIHAFKSRVVLISETQILGAGQGTPDRSTPTLACSTLSRFGPTFRAKCPAAHGLIMQA